LLSFLSLVTYNISLTLFTGELYIIMDVVKYFYWECFAMSVDL
jgi:hypothetical protein